MPSIPGPAQPPYDTADYVLNLARTRMNDAIQTLAGDVMSDTQPYMLTAFNGAWRRLQEALADQGAAALTKEAIIPSIPVVGSIDPASQAYLSWSNYFDGLNLWPGPLLPQNLILPLRLWERISGTTQQFIEMSPVNDGLPSDPKTLRLQYWEWRGDAIWMIGALQINDIRLRYAAYLPDLETLGTTRVPIMRCGNALAWLVCSEVANARGDIDGSSFDAKAENAIEKMLNREARMKQRGRHRRQPYSSRAHSGWGIF